jgi:quercetin dioxygenase-like cupin family protein
MANEKSTQPRVNRSGEPIGLYINRYPLVEKIQFDPMRVSTSKDPDVAPLLAEIRKPVFEAEFKGEIDKAFLPVELSNFRDMVFTQVKGALRVEPHTHPGTMFGVVVDGRLRINGVELERGDFYLVPPGQAYGIETVDGYNLVAAYNNSC